jgi:DNA-directed RNA polymerase specialized sigma24 family protein
VVSHTASGPDTASLQKQLEQELVRLYREHASELSRYAASFSESQNGAREAVQVIFLRYFIERRYGRQIENPRAWLYHVLRNYFRDPAPGA